MIFKPCLYGICKINSLSAEVNSWKASRTFEVPDDVSVVLCIADLRNSEKPDQFLFCHNGGTETDLIF